VEQRDVVRGGKILGRRSGKLAEADRENGGTQRVLERLRGAEIGREREGANNLGCTDSRLVGWRPCRPSPVVRHAVTLLPRLQGRCCSVVADG
jgi:hypothetical protein